MDFYQCFEFVLMFWISTHVLSFEFLLMFWISSDVLNVYWCFRNSQESVLFDLAALQHTATWLTRVCNMTLVHVWREKSSRVLAIRVIWQHCNTLQHDSFISTTWLFWMCDMTFSYVYHESCECVTWPIHMCNMTLWNVWHNVFMCDKWVLWMCDMKISQESVL